MLLGNLGRDAEVGYTASQVSIVKFSVATQRRWKDEKSGDWKEETDWHNVVLWRGDKIAPYLTRGSRVFVEGRIQTRSYEKAGEKKYVTEIVADSVILCRSETPPRRLCGANERAGADAAEPAPRATATSRGGIDEDDIPF